MIINDYDVTDGVVIGGSTNRRYTMHNAAGEQQGGPVYARNDASALREFREQHPECFTDEYRERYGPYEMRCHEK